MYALDVAIQALWTANQLGTLAPIVGGLSADLQAAGVAMPYAVMFDNQGGPLIRSFKPTGATLTVAEPCVIQITVFCEGRAQAKLNSELIASVFDDAQINLATGYAIQCVRSRPIIVRTDPVTAQDSSAIQVWQGILFYKILVSPS